MRHPGLKKNENGKPQKSLLLCTMSSSSFSVERKVVLPSNLVAEFEKIAQPNTDLPPYGIETCGILAGRLVSQTGTAVVRSACHADCLQHGGFFVVCFLCVVCACGFICASRTCHAISRAQCEVLSRNTPTVYLVS